ncbi:GNAT family N-acetyltransferase [Jinshanibacter sp. LJY008]|uniref:GNAT family N-acetyltransferase n=1 Tax=Limnobaculum eriocheiris TaxID=2897391 RepID=A0A9X1SK05_9GAMM|nr:GNAT family N-acetyltransferase [Limnobaculum eriocheiris]
MSNTLNQYQQPVGETLTDWQPRQHPQRLELVGEYCRLEPLQAARHAADLFHAFSQAPDGRDWTYMAYGPFDDSALYFQHVEQASGTTDPLHFAIIDQTTNRAVGTIALMRIDKVSGVMEVGHVTFSPLLKQTRIATEAQYLLMCYAFDKLGYRRYEWKCDNLNAPSRSAAQRLGFTFEGIFRQAVVYKQRTRDTAWFSILDREWPVIKAGMERWLNEANFDDNGKQKRSLKACREL